MAVEAEAVVEAFKKDEIDAVNAALKEIKAKESNPEGFIPEAEEAENKDAASKGADSDKDANEAEGEVKEGKESEQDAGEKKEEAEKASDSKKASEGEGAAEKKAAEQPAANDESALIEEIAKQYAEELSIDIDEARKFVEKDKHVAEQFGAKLTKENLKLAKALRSTKSERDKMEAAEKLRKEDQERHVPKEFPIEQYIQAINDGKTPDPDNPGYMLKRDEVLEKFRKKNPRYEDVDDDIVVEIFAKSWKANGDKVINEKRSELKAQAKEKRIEILQNVGNGMEKRFYDIVRDTVNALPDNDILKSNFSVDPIVRLAKAEYYDSDVKDLNAKIKAAREEGYQAGLKAKTIKFEQADSTAQGGTPAKGTVSLSPVDRKRAVNMFPDMPLEEAYAAFKEVIDRTKT